MNVTTAKHDTRNSAAADQRFRRHHRLLDGEAFGRVFRQAGRSKDPLFTVLYRRNNSSDARLGLAISKKNCRQAVGRNRLKRLIRESFRHNKTLLAGLDIVVLNQAATHKANNAALFEALDHHWARCAKTRKSPPPGDTR